MAANTGHTRVYSYACDTPTAGWAAARAEMQRQIALWNRLVAIEDAHVAGLRATAAAQMPELAATQAALDQARAELTSGGAAAPADADGADARERERRLARELAARYREWRRANPATVKDLEARRRAEVKAARQATPAFWGNYNRVLQDYERTRRHVQSHGGRLRPRDPDDLQRGVLTVQIMRTRSGPGAAPAELYAGQFAKLRLAPIPDHAAKCRLNRGRRARATRTHVRMRADAAGNTISLPVVMHRPLPEDARVKLAQLVWRRVGDSIQFSLHLTLALPPPAAAPSSPAVAGLDLGWRQDADGALRVATLRDSAGHERMYHLPRDWTAGMDRVDALQAAIAREARDLLAWARAQPAARLPESLRAQLAEPEVTRLTLGPVHDAIRATGPAAWPEPLRTWYRRYRRQRAELVGLRGRLQRRRREIYRLMARELAMRYPVIAIDRLDLAGMAKTGAGGAGRHLPQDVRRNRVRASLHLARRVLGEQAAKHGARLIVVAGKSTATCHACGRATGQADRRREFWTCEHCGTRWDQDRNAAANLVMVAASERAREATTP